jgi:hypothetical protein
MSYGSYPAAFDQTIGEDREGIRRQVLTSAYDGLE